MCACYHTSDKINNESWIAPKIVAGLRGFIFKNMCYQSYDNWKLANPYDEDATEYAPVEVDVEIFDLGDRTIEDIDKERGIVCFVDGYDGMVALLRTTIKVDVCLTVDGRDSSVENDDVNDAVSEYFGNGSDYEILDWREIHRGRIY